ncbi:winged helix-turn-helix domain-containing protein [Amycolatopsis sp. NPDC051373]|uniref:winged helix-turn-helix domain-containing protein n=1 Tax=Amycolatopsis sp. NPDC051373 TaxID=3155801 RepID=UPI00344CD6FB
MRLSLTRTQFALLELLLSRQGTPVSHTDLLDHGWDAMVHPDSTVLPGQISRLRGKLGDPPLIHAVPGVGYVLAPG